MMVKGLNFKRGIFLLLFVFLLVIPFAFADDELLWSGTVSSGSSADVDGKKLSVDLTETQASVNYEGIVFLVDKMKCDKNGFYKVCFTGSKSTFSADISLYYASS